MSAPISTTSTDSRWGFFQKNGNYIGISLSVLWVCLASYVSYYIYNLNKYNEPNKNYYFIIPFILLFIIILSNGLYIADIQNAKSTDPEFVGKSKTVYANVSLIPIYFIILYISMYAIMHNPFMI